MVYAQIWNTILPILWAQIESAYERSRRKGVRDDGTRI